MSQKLKKNRPKVVGINTICKSQLFGIESVHLQFSNGQERHFERIRGWTQGSVMIVPMLDENTLLLIREYSVGIEGYTLGFPKGAMHENEDVLVTANRELQEEVGYAARKLSQVMKFCVSPGYLTTSMCLVLAHDLYPSVQEGDEPEPLEVLSWSLDQVDALLKHPEFLEARSIAALLWIDRKRRQSAQKTAL